jgi:hypothetical protein
MYNQQLLSYYPYPMPACRKEPSMPVVDPIHPEGQSNLRPGRFVTVLRMPDLHAVVPYTDEAHYVSRHALCGILMKVLAVQVPYVACSVEVMHNEIPSGTRLMLDLRRYELGFVTPDFVRRIKKHEQTCRSRQSTSWSTIQQTKVGHADR